MQRRRDGGAETKPVCNVEIIEGASMGAAPSLFFSRQSGRDERKPAPKRRAIVQCRQGGRLQGERFMRKFMAFGLVAMAAFAAVPSQAAGRCQAPVSTQCTTTDENEQLVYCDVYLHLIP